MLVPPPAPAFPPAGLVDWLQADDTSKIVTQATDDGLNVDSGPPVDGHYVYTWSDSNGGAIEFGPDNGHSPTWLASGGINGLASVRFNPASVRQRLTTTQFSSLGLSAVEVFLVVRSTDTSDTHGLWDFSASSAVFCEWYPIDAAGGVYENFGSNTRIGPASHPDLSVAHVYNVRTNGSTIAFGWDDATDSLSGSSGGVGFSSTQALGDAFEGGGSPYDGMVGEMLVFDHFLSSGDRAKVFSHLRTKWGTP